jgi:hypothetical protein
MPPAGGYRRDNVVNGFGYDDAYRDLAIIGAICRIQRAATIVETNFAPDFILQLCRQSLCIEQRGRLGGHRFLLMCLKVLAG